MSLIKDAGGQIAGTVLANQKVAIAIPAITTVIGAASAQSILTIVSMSIGIVISCLILWHRYVLLQTARIEHKEARARLEEITKI